MYDPQGLSLQIFRSRHAAHDKETWEEACDRVALHVSNAEDGEKRSIWRDKFNWALQHNLFMPGGRIWYGSGRPRGNLLNCYVIPTSDSREGWGKTVSDTIVISGTGGGVGCNFSPSRPRGTAIRGTGGTSTGSVSEMEMVNSVGNVIKAGGGRRVALMFCLSLSHGDIVEFLDKKLDLKELNNANVSVVFDEDPEAFFALVRTGAEWPLIHQGRQVGSMPAQLLWERIVVNALKGGEPGLLNGFLANRMSNIWYLEALTSTNPCQPAWATLLTPGGIRTMGEISVGDTVWSGKRWTKVVRKLATGVKKVKAYRTRAGTFYGTENHRVVQEGVKIEAKDATAIDLAQGAFEVNPNPTALLDELDGLVFGDGTYHEASRRVFLCAGETEIALYRNYFGALIGSKYEVTSRGAYGVPATRFDYLPLTFDRSVPSEYLSNLTRGVSFLRGLYTANGSVVANRVTLKGASFKVIEQVQQMLSALGISSYYTVNKEHDVQHHNGVYTSRQSYDLNIGTREGRVVFAKLIGFLQPHKTDRLLASLDVGPSFKPIKTTYDIVEIEDISEEEVFDITVDDPEHVYWTGGLSVSNCGEIWMSPYDCCCLGALVLPRFVIGGEVDWDLLKDATKTGIRFLDDVLTVNNYPLPEIQAKCAQLRRVGLGVTGLHHMLLELGLKYNSPEGLEFVDKLMNKIKNWSYEVSIDLAAEKGAFPGYDSDKFWRSGFTKHLKPSLREKGRKHGIRNCATMTIAPVGTGSIICDVSSGIEPIYAMAHIRKFRRGDELVTEEVVDMMFQRFVNEGRDVSHFVGAMDLTIRDHMSMQRVCQRHVDNAVSKTINLPAGTTFEELSAAYMEFFPDLKGVTVYPDGSREDQPLTPLPLARAIELAKTARGETSSIDPCRSGNCDV